jgi:hypothetical protein
MIKNIFKPEIAEKFINRINTLTPNSQTLWGKMSVAQMLAHCNVTYEMVYEDRHKKPNALMKFILKTFVKKKVTNEVPYKQNGQTAPQFIIKDSRDFEPERQRLISYINKTTGLGENHFEGKESHSFGKLSKTEWNNMFYKHLDHHLQQFGV